ncbi:MAG: hypothetical protein JRG69_12130 [Deltaproteobacteria bacterium]|nr:hypothetical protein [Deltaproteobacteria bacterium]
MIEKVDMGEKGWSEYREKVRKAALKNPGSFCRADNRWLGEDVVKAVNDWVEARGGQAYLDEVERKAKAAFDTSMTSLLLPGERRK